MAGFQPDLSQRDTLLIGLNYEHLSSNAKKKKT